MRMHSFTRRRILLKWEGVDWEKKGRHEKEGEGRFLMCV